MRKYSKKIRKTVEDPKSEICGKHSKNKKVNKPYKLLYRWTDNQWNRSIIDNQFNTSIYSKEWRVWSEFKNKSDRDHEFDKCKRSYKFWEWDTKDEIEQEIVEAVENSCEKECKS